MRDDVVVFRMGYGFVFLCRFVFRVLISVDLWGDWFDGDETVWGS